MEITNHIDLLFWISIFYSIWLIRAIYKNDLGLRDKLIKSFIGKDKIIALTALVITTGLGLYAIKTHPKSSDAVKRKKIRQALKTGILAFIIAFFGHLGLWIAPFFFTLVIELIEF